MSNLVPLTSASRASAVRNISRFVEHCRHQLSAFGRAFDFDNHRWPVLTRRGVSNTQHLVFSKLGTRSGERGPPLAEPFCSFAKAYLRHLQEERPGSPTARMNALRGLEWALSTAHSGRAEVHRLTADIFTSAVAELDRRLAKHSAYSAGLELNKLADFLNFNGMVLVPLSWRSHLSRPRLERLGGEYERRRATLLPSPAALAALGAAFCRATEPRDQLAAAAMALDMVAHGRICEVLTLPATTEVVSVREGSDRGTALNWWPAKGGAPTMKLMLPEFEPIARKALQVIRRLTAPARQIAAWYERHPTKLYLAPELEPLRRQEFVTLREVERITGLKNGNGFVSGLPFRIRPDRQKDIRFADLEKRVLAFLPKEFPIFDAKVGIRFSEALFVVPARFFSNPSTPHLACMFSRVTSTQINTCLGARIPFHTGERSMFERLGFREDSGKPIIMTTHMMRRYLSDLAQRNRLDQLDLAAWAGRSPPQNRTYDFSSEAERLAAVRTALGTRARWNGPTAEIASRVPLSREEFAQAAVPTAHTTELGICIHDFSMFPCSLHLDCAFCTEHVCIKGDKIRAERVRAWLAENKALLASARSAMTRAEYGSDRWVEHTTKTVARLHQLDQLLHDPTIPDGSVIQLSGGHSPSRLRDAIERRATLDAGCEGTARSRRRLPPRPEPRA